MFSNNIFKAFLISAFLFSNVKAQEEYVVPVACCNVGYLVSLVSQLSGSQAVLELDDGDYIFNGGVGVVATDLTIRSKNPLGAKLIYNGLKAEFFSIIGASNFTMDGLEITGGDKSTNVIKIQDGSNITIKNCKIHDAGDGGDIIKVTASDGMQSHNINILDNELFNAGWTTGTEMEEMLDFIRTDTALVSGNWMYFTENEGNQLTYGKGECYNIVWENNVFGPANTNNGFSDPPVGGGTAWYEMIYNMEGATYRNNIFMDMEWGGVGIYAHKNIRIYNNIFYNVGRAPQSPGHGVITLRWGGGALPNNNTDLYVHNNIFYDSKENSMPFIYYMQNATGVSLDGDFEHDHNLYFNDRANGPIDPITSYGTVNASTEPGSLFKVDPLFANPGSGNDYESIVNGFRPAANSPIFGKGKDLSMESVGNPKDIDGNDLNAGNISIGPFAKDGGSAVLGNRQTVNETGLQASPNPFNPSTTIRIPNGYVDHLSIYSVDGRKILAEKNLKSGIFTWDAQDQANGLYLLRVQSEGILYKKTLILSK